MTQIVVKRGDTKPWRFRLRNGKAGPYVNLDGASVVFNMQPVVGGMGSTIQRGPAVVLQTNFELDGGLVEYRPSPDDVDVVGQHVAEFEVTFGDATTGTFPEEEEIGVLIRADLG
jgi:hypothetical protein